MDRRTFLKSVAGLTATSMLPLDSYAQQHKGKVKITDVKCMIVRGTWDWNLIKIETDSGVYGIGEAYWGWGVKDLVVNKLRPIVVGEDPLNVDKLYTKMLMESAGAGRACRRHRHRRQRHRDRVVGPGGPDPPDACVQPAGRTVPRSGPFLPHDARCRASRGSTGLARAGTGGQGGEVRLDRVQVPGRWHSTKGRSRLQRAGARSIYPWAHAQGFTAHRPSDGDCARGIGPRRRFRCRSALEVRRA